MFILNKLQLVYRTLRIYFKFFILFCGMEYPDQLCKNIFMPLFASSGMNQYMQSRHFH